MMSEGPRVLPPVRRSGLRRRGKRSARADLRAAVRVQRIVRRELTRHIVVVIPGDGLEARGEGVEPCRLRGELARRRIGAAHDKGQRLQRRDRKSTRLNSSHLGISYAVFCLKKKKRTLL